MPRLKKVLKRIGISLVVLVLLGVIGVMLWSKNFSYMPDDTALKYLSGGLNVSVYEADTGYVFDGPGNRDLLIFYPGAFVSCEAYAPLLSKIAENGIDCALVKMPFNLAFLGKNKADEVTNSCPYENIIISGHSLGGAFAAKYYAEHSDKLSGLILFASYSTEDLTSTDRPVICLTGTNDKIINRERFDECKTNLPANSKILEINGGNHSQVGSYGLQSGDGEAIITPEEQWDALTEWVVYYADWIEKY